MQIHTDSQTTVGSKSISRLVDELESWQISQNYRISYSLPT